MAQNGERHRPSSSARTASPWIQRCAGDVVEEVASGSFTAPNDSPWAPTGGCGSRNDPVGGFKAASAPGHVWALDRTSGQGRADDGGLEFPNGLAFHGDDLYLAETRRRRILRYRITSAGISAAQELVAFDRGTRTASRSTSRMSTWPCRTTTA